MPRRKPDQSADTVPISIYVPQEKKEIIQERAKKNHRSLSQEALYLIELALKALEQSQIREES